MLRKEIEMRVNNLYLRCWRILSIELRLNLIKKNVQGRILLYKINREESEEHLLSLLEDTCNKLSIAANLWLRIPIQNILLL